MQIKEGHRKSTKKPVFFRFNVKIYTLPMQEKYGNFVSIVFIYTEPQMKRPMDFC